MSIEKAKELIRDDILGDQGHDGPYGTGPRHGNIVFRIGRTKFKGVLNTDACVYFLLASIDFKLLRGIGVLNQYGSEFDSNLYDVLRTRDKYIGYLEVIETKIANTNAEALLLLDKPKE